MNPADINYMEISKSALLRNAKVIASQVKVPVIAMLKCDGYGVSLPEAAQIWKQAGVSFFAVAKPEEALALRHEGFTEEILLTTPVADGEMLNRLLYHNVVLTVSSLSNAEFYSLYANRFPVRVHVAVDTGMGRFGINWDDTAQLKALYQLNGFSFEGIFSHFSQSFEPTYRQTHKQLDRFLAAIDALAAQDIAVGLRHIANSCAALRFPETRLDAVRIGSAFVGRLPRQSPVFLVPVGTFKAQVVEVKHFRKGETTGYGSLCKIRHDTQAAIVAIGRENGFGVTDCLAELPFRLRLAQALRLLAPQSLSVQYRGLTLPLLGRVGTQYTLFDATGLDLRPGEYVTADVPLLFPGHQRHWV